MNVFNEYIKLYQEANNYFWQDNAKEAIINEYSKKLNKLRSKFNKEDWEKLIAQSTGRAKYEYTRMMNEKFPENKNI